MVTVTWTNEARNAARERERAANTPKYQRDLRMSREAKRRRRGTCERCGGETRYNGDTVNGPSRVCRSCATRENGQRLAGTGARQRQLYAILSAAGEARYSSIRDALGVSNRHAAVLLTIETQAGRIERVRRGVYRLPT